MRRHLDSNFPLVYSHVYIMMRQLFIIAVNDDGEFHYVTHVKTQSWEPRTDTYCFLLPGLAAPTGNRSLEHT